MKSSDVVQASLLFFVLMAFVPALARVVDPAIVIESAPVVVPNQPVITLPPPMPLVETIPIAPYPDGVWITGYWNWVGGEYIWTPGRWERPPGIGHIWDPHRWENYNGHWSLKGGRWGHRR